MQVQMEVPFRSTRRETLKLDYKNKMENKNSNKKEGLNPNFFKLRLHSNFNLSPRCYPSLKDMPGYFLLEGFL